MAFVLNIDTAVQSASICLAEGNKVIATSVNPAGRDTAAWLHPAIKNLLSENGLSVQEIDAVAISAGPGSYTGLRVGMAAAKGLCYALSLPLIAVSTLQMMAAAALPVAENASLFCPMIDARRMEVFAALYKSDLTTVLPPVNLVLDDAVFSEWLAKTSIVFFGNGSEKAKSLIKHPHASFADVQITAEHMANLSWKRFCDKQFLDLAYSEPFYGKDFYSPLSKKIS